MLSQLVAALPPETLFVVTYTNADSLPAPGPRPRLGPHDPLAHPETVFTYGAPALKFGAGASDEIGYDLATYGVRRVLRGHRPGRRRDRAPAADRRADRRPRHRGACCSTGPTSSPPTRASSRRSSSPATTGPWDAFVAVGGGSAIDTAKAVNLLATNPGELLDYVNAPVGKGRAPEHAAERRWSPCPTTTGTGSESTTICVLDVLAQHVKTGISHPRLRPDPGRRRPAADR